MLVTKRTVDRQRELLSLLRAGTRVEEGCRQIGIAPATFRSWKYKDSKFASEAAQAKAIGQRAREQVALMDKVFDPDEWAEPQVPPFRTFRTEFIGRPTPAHQEPLIEAWEDKTNRIVIYLASPSSGKDTTAGDIVLHELVDRWKRVAWVMESANFSTRRLSRLEGYLWDERTYVMPPKTPGAVAPTRMLFREFGPFKWEKGMVYPDGTKIPQPKWTQNELYFLGRDNEADPNLWATGIEGAMYGARIDRAVLSDIFTEENQQSPARRDAQIGWLVGTFLSRLDDKGRALFLGTRVAEWDNWARLIEELVGQSPVLWEDQFTTKYANGVAVVVVPAIQQDADGADVSYWPERFPLRTRLVKGDVSRFLDELSEDEHRLLARQGFEMVSGLYDMRGDSPAKVRWFNTAYQQSPPSSEEGEFPLALLNRCDDYERSYGQHKPGSTLVLGIDPAHRGGAAWVLWEWNGETLMVVDWFFGTNIGVTGLRERLLVDPISRYAPRYAIYESNRETSVLEHPEVMNAARVYRTEIKGVPTHAFNRGVGELRVAAMSSDMANGMIRFPAATQEDRRRSDQLKEQFLNWDARERMRKTDSQMRLHIPDDLAMAAWVGWVKMKQLVGQGRERNLPKRLVAPSVARSWGYAPILGGKSSGRSQMPTDLVGLYYGKGGE